MLRKCNLAAKERKEPKTREHGNFDGITEFSELTEFRQEEYEGREGEIFDRINRIGIAVAAACRAAVQQFGWPRNDRRACVPGSR